jgi:hypothetical protein
MTKNSFSKKVNSASNLTIHKYLLELFVGGGLIFVPPTQKNVFKEITHNPKTPLILMCFFPVYLQMLTSYATCMVQVIYPS